MSDGSNVVIPRSASDEESTLLVATPAGALLRRDHTWVLGGANRASTLVAAYLALSAGLLASRGDLRLATINLALVALIGYTLRAPGAAAVAPRLFALAPLVIAAALYGEIPHLIAAAGATYHDLLIQHLEQAIFGTQPSRTFAAALPMLGVSEILHAGYVCFYPMIFVPPLVLAFRADRRGLEETVFAVTLAMIVCWALFVVFPVQGPRYLWGAPAGVPDGPMRRLAAAILAAGSSRGAAFPSSHVAVSVVQSAFAWRYQRRGMAIAVTVVTVLVGFGAVYGGFHYGVDVLAGAAVGLALAAAAPSLSGRATSRR